MPLPFSVDRQHIDGVKNRTMWTYQTAIPTQVGVEQMKWSVIPHSYASENPLQKNGDGYFNSKRKQKLQLDILDVHNWPDPSNWVTMTQNKLLEMSFKKVLRSFQYLQQSVRNALLSTNFSDLQICRLSLEDVGGFPKRSHPKGV